MKSTWKQLMRRYTGDFFYSSHGLFILCVFFLFHFFGLYFLSIFNIFRYRSAFWLTVATPLQRNLLTKLRFITILKQGKWPHGHWRYHKKGGGELRSRVLFCEVHAQWCEDDACLSWLNILFATGAKKRLTDIRMELQHEVDEFYKRIHEIVDEHMETHIKERRNFRKRRSGKILYFDPIVTTSMRSFNTSSSYAWRRLLWT